MAKDAAAGLKGVDAFKVNIFHGITRIKRPKSINNCPLSGVFLFEVNSQVKRSNMTGNNNIAGLVRVAKPKTAPVIRYITKDSLFTAIPSKKNAKTSKKVKRVSVNI